MSTRIGVSGCFGNEPNYEKIDTVEDASAVVEDLQGTPVGNSEVAEDYLITVQQLSVVAKEYAKRIRILTYGMIAVAAYLVIKELKH